jgi:2-dehydropantoate 2-reductase
MDKQASKQAGGKAMRIAVVGTGGVGGYFGARLVQAGEDVVFLARGAHLQALRSSGLHVQSINGDVVLPAVQATDDPAQVGTVDVVLVAVKAWQVPEAAQAIKPLVGAETMVVPLENGVEAPAQLAAAVGAAHVLGGFCWIVSFIAAPGVIHHTGVEPHIAFGEMDNRRTERVERLVEACTRAGIKKVEVPDDIQAALWQKFTFIASMSGMGAVTRATVGVMRTLPQTRQMIAQAINEIIAVAQRRGIALSDDVLAATMRFIDSMPPQSTLSMQRDMMEGRPSELESQNGAVVRLGSEVGVATPLHAFLYRSLLPMELAARGQLPAVA